jgi:hypothetical protein
MPTFELSANGKTFEIDAPDQGAAVSAFQKMQGEQPSVAGDVAKSAGVGIGKGALNILGSIGDYSDLGAKGLEAADRFISNKLGMEPYKPPMDRSQSVLNNIPTSASLQKNVEGVTGEFYKPQTTAGKYAETIGEFLPSAAVGPGSAVGRVAAAMAAGAGSEGAGQLTQGTAAEPYARVAGALAGGFAPAMAGRAVTPLPASEARQRLVGILNNEGVDSLTAGQRTGNKALQYVEDFLGNAPGAGQAANNIRQRGQEQFTEATMRRAGAGPDATPEILAQNNARLGNQFEQLSARNDLTPDNQFITDLTTAVRDYRNVPPSQQRAILQGYVDDIIGHVNAGQMPGPQYQEMRSRLSRQANGLRNSDPTLSDALRDMRNALDNAMERSIPAGSGDAELWRQSRREYRAQKTIEKAASRAGEATAEGQIVPANLRNAVSAENRGAYARGEGDFSELARAGSGVMAPLPNSGTAQRLNLKDLVMLPVSATVGRAVMSRPVQSYLGNQALARQLESLPPGQIAVLRALMSAQRPQIEP